MTEEITHEDVERATRKFLESGLIRKLPDEKVIYSIMVGERHGAYESIFEGGGYNV